MKTHPDLNPNLKFKRQPWRLSFYILFVTAFLFLSIFPVPISSSFSQFIPTARAAAPSNDFAANATEISGGLPQLTVPVNLSEASIGSNPGNDPAVGNANFTVWYTLTAQPDLVYRLQTCNNVAPANTVPDTIIGVFLGGPGGPWTTVTTNDEFCASQSLVTFRNTTANPQVYWIMVGKFGATAPVAGQTDVQLYVDTLSPPANDYAKNALPVNGAFPYTSQPVTISGASTGNNPAAEPTNPASANFTIWYTFTATTANIYSVQTCASYATGTTVADTVLGVYTTTNGANGPFNLISSNDNACGLQSIVTFAAVPATTYWIMVGKNGASAPVSGQDSLQLYITENTNNDNLAGALPLTLNLPIAATNQFATNDYQLVSASPCFSGIGQSANTAAGRDLVYSFQAPTTSKYSFKITGYNSFGNLTLYLANSLPNGIPPLTVTDCVKAANRNSFSTNGTEEIYDVSLTAGTLIYLVVDEAGSGSVSTFRVEVSLSNTELEPNNSTAEATSPTCFTTGATGSAGDVDFYALGTPPVNSRVFALVDAYAANAANFDLRVNTTGDTLEFDDDNNDIIFGQNAPNIAGTILPGTAAYLQVNYNGNATAAEPYRLYSVVQPPLNGATIENEPNNSITQANFAPANYFSGTLPSGADSDYYGFAASAGQVVYIGLDADPTRNATPFNGALELYDQNGTLLIGTNDTSSLTNGTSSVSGAGSLTATSPKAIGEGLVYRFSRSGIYYLKVLSGVSPTPAAGDYLISIAKDCSKGFGGLPLLNLSSGDNQITPVDTPFTSALAISLTTPEGKSMEDMRVTFTAPASGASGVFANGLTSYVTRTNANGVAAALPFTANSIAGSYGLTVTLDGTSSLRIFNLTNRGTPSSLTATNGSNQITPINTNFALPLEATVRDAANTPVAGILVTFSTPNGAGASATFEGNSIYTATTNASGIATATARANATVGSYSVTASVTDLPGVVSFVLTNSVSSPANLSIVSGNNQTTVIDTGFSVPLVVKVTDSGNNPIAGTTVSFTLPGSGASAVFSGSAGASSYLTQTDAAGIATSTLLVANGVTGSYNVTATVSGIITPALFNLSNTTDCVSPLSVTQTTDDGLATVCGSFSRALKIAGTSGGGQISFSFATKTAISVTGALPDVPPNTVINAGCLNNEPQVSLVGSGILTDALRLTSSTTITGLAVGGFGGYAVNIQGSSNQLDCAWLGTLDGQTARPNGGGIRTTGSNTPPGFNTFHNNLISGNTGWAIESNSLSGNVFSGNLIGLQKNGNAPLPNGRNIQIIAGSKSLFLPGNAIQR